MMMGAPRELSAYELERLANIERNERYLGSLGLGSKKKKSKPVRKRKVLAPTQASVAPPRRSARLSGEKEAQVVPPFEKETPSSSFVERAAVPEGSLEDSSLKQIYSASSRDGTIAAGGKGGRVAVFGNFRASFRGCQGWVGGVEILGRRLLCCGNDGALNAWDVSVENSQGEPRLVGSARPHSSGVWSLSVLGDRAATGAKDGAVNVARLATLETELRIDDVSAHGSVKCVALRGNSVAAACDDGPCRVFDLRSTIQSIWDGSHESATSVAWIDERVLLTSGLDGRARLWDLRRNDVSSVALFTVGCHNSRRKAIRHPTVLGPQTFVVAGEGTASLEVYDVPSASLIKTVPLASDATAVARDDDHNIDGDACTAVYAALAAPAVLVHTIVL